MAVVTTEITTAVLYELRKHLEGLGLQGLANLAEPVAIIQGFPQSGDLELPAISITPGDEVWAHVYPEPVENIDNGDGTVTTTFKTADLELPIQLDVWTGGETMKVQRYKLMPHVLDVFGAKIEPDADGVLQARPAGLELNLADHYGALCRYHVRSGQLLDEQTQADGLARKTLTLMAETDRLTERTVDAATFEQQ